MGERDERLESQEFTQHHDVNDDEEELMPTYEQRSNAAFSDLQDFAAELAASWINGNKSDVVETLEDKPIVALLLGDELLGPNQCFEIALALHKRGWEG